MASLLSQEQKEELHADFSNPQTQPIQQGKNHEIDPTAVPTIIVVGQFRCQLQQLLGLRSIEYKHHLGSGRMARPALNR
jgi:hypothetical protein